MPDHILCGGLLDNTLLEDHDALIEITTGHDASVTAVIQQPAESRRVLIYRSLPGEALSDIRELDFDGYCEVHPGPRKPK